MRKFTLFFSLLLAIATTAFAQESATGASAPINFDWTGTFTVTATPNNLMADIWACPETFTLKTEYNKDWDMITITEILDKDIFNTTSGGWGLIVADDKRSAEISFFNYKYGLIEQFDSFGHIVLRNADQNKSTITLTVNDEGIVTVEDLSIGYAASDGANWIWQMEITSLTGVTATKVQENNPTTIETIGSNDAKIIYNAAGRRIETISHPGLYIVNGVKVFVK